MASYQARGRDPLFDGETQALLERRGKELLGLGLIALGALIWAMLWSYAPNDPSWLSATDAPVQNWLGGLGASMASPMMVVAGVATFAIAVTLMVWGTRFMLHQGVEYAIPRVIFAPIAIALAAVYASTHVPPSSWSHSFGLGGLFGDTVLGALLGIVPIKATMGLRIMAFFMGVGTIAMAAFVLGFTRAELVHIGRWMGLGMVMTYALIIGMLKALVRGGLHLFIWLRSAMRSDQPDPQAARAQAPVVQRTVVMAADPPPAAQEIEVVPPKPGLIASLLRRSPAAEVDGANDDGIKKLGDPAVTEMITRAIKSRRSMRRGSAPDGAPGRSEPPLARGAGDSITTAIEAAAARAAMAHSGSGERQIFSPSRMPEPDPKKVVQHIQRKSVPSKQARAEAQPALDLDAAERPDYEVPPLSLLSNPVNIQRTHLSDEALEENARMLENVLDDYGVKGEIVSVRPGPVVTMYELEPAPGLKASRVIGLADDIARSMSALSARVSTVPGRSVIGIELPNDSREKVLLREILSAREFGDTHARLPLALGKDIGGDPVVANLAKMPHLLIAGTTGSGKSVAINTMILSLLYRLSPEDCRLIMIDPKMLELSVYDGIPHLLSPVVTDPRKAVVALKWVVGEMEERYRKMSRMGVRNIEGYNSRVADALSRDEMFSRTVQTGFDDASGDPVFETDEYSPEKLPYIVVIVDEMADLMMVAGKEIEACIQRLAQMARASGIHLIMATQRPSVDVITGTIKANFPTRISFQVTGKIDSRTILGEQGAEQLLGMGDMLYMAGGAKIIRVHGPFVSDEEVEEIVTHLKAYGAPEYVGGVIEGPDEETENDIDLVLGLGGNTEGTDALYDQAVQIVLMDRKCSTSYIQRKLAIGYNKAARLVEQMEDHGLVTAANHVGKREILVPERV